MAQNEPLPTEQLRTLAEQLASHFSLPELYDLAFDLGLERENVPGDTRGAFARELLLALNRALQLPTLLARLTAARADVAWALDDVDRPAQPPYRGLEYYREQDTSLFFGRDRLTADLIRRLRAHPFLAVIGASGSGKSSLIRAGVIPALKCAQVPGGGRAPAGSADWAYLTITPTGRPLERLAVALTADLPAAAAVAADLRASADALRLAAGQYLDRTGRPRLLLLIDQFEEVFTACKDDDERRAFIDNLLAAAGSQVTVILTLRADFYHRCDPYPALRAALETRQAYIGPPDREELRAAIVEPASRRGYLLEEGLADLMLRDAGDEPGALPLLSHALLETWKRRDGLAMTLDGYNRAGGVRGAIAHTAESLFADLDEPQQATMQRILIDLTELGEGAEDTRRRVARAELAGQPWFRDDGAPVLEQLVSARLATADDDTVQIAHEALIREWPRLGGWLAADRQGEHLRRDLAAAARRWAHAADDSYLFTGARLATAREWAAASPDRLDETSHAFLTAATHREERQAREAEAARQRELANANALAAAETRRARVTRRLLYVAGVLALLAVAAAIYALNRSGEAQRQAQRAEQSLVTATVARGAAEAESTRADQSRLIAVAAQSTAEAERDRADANAREAEQRADEAQSRQLVAEAGALSELNALRAVLLSVAASHLSDTAEVFSAINRYTRALPRRTVSIEHAGKVHGATWNSDESRLLTWSEDGTAGVWDAATGQLLFSLQHQGWVNGASWNPDESRILTWGFGRMTAVWDASSGERLLVFEHESTVNGAIWNNNGTRILTWSYQQPVVLWDATTGERLLTLAHDAGLSGAAWNVDETRIIAWTTYSDDPVIKVWDAASGEPLHTMTPDAEGDDAITNSDGTRIITWRRESQADAVVWSTVTGQRLLTLPHDSVVVGASWNKAESQILVWGGGYVRAWDARTGQPLLTLSNDNWYYGASWNADESRILTRNGNNTISVWDAASGGLLLSLHHDNWVEGAAWSNQGDRILTWSQDGAIGVWDATIGDSLFALNHEQRVTGAMWSEDGDRVLTWSEDGSVAVWDMGSNFFRLTHRSYVPRATWNNDETRILTASSDGTAAVWDAASGQRLFTMAHPEWVDYAAWNNDNSLILTWSEDGVTNIWDAFSGERIADLSSGGWGWSINWSADGSRILALGDNVAAVLNPLTGEQMLTLTHEDTVYGAAWNSDESLILTWLDNGTVTVWDGLTGQQLTQFIHGDRISSALWSPDDTRILTWSFGEVVNVWDARTGKNLHVLDHDGSINSAQWNHSGSRILTPDSDGAVKIWDAISGEHILTLTHSDSVSKAAWSADEARLLTWSLDGTAVIWDAASGERLLTLAHDGPVSGALWNADESRLLTWGADRKAIVWDTATGDRLQELEGDSTRISSAAWNADESQIMLATDGGNVFRYYTQMDDLLAAACERVTRNFTWDEWRLYFPGEPYRCTCPNRPIHQSVLESPDAVVDETAVCAPQ